MKIRFTLWAAMAATSVALVSPAAHGAPRTQARTQPQPRTQVQPRTQPRPPTQTRAQQTRGQAQAQALRQYRFIDEHPTGGAGANGKTYYFTEGDPGFQIEPAGLCGQPFIGGTVEGHPDPRLTDASAICGHGYVYEIGGTAQDPSRPLSIQPITEPIDPDAPAAPGNQPGDARRVIREQLPQLDRPGGDSMAIIRDLRVAVHLTDVSRAAKSLPRRLSK